MPGDTLHINNQAQQQNTYDAIVIGSGINDACGWTVFLQMMHARYQVHVKILY